MTRSLAFEAFRYLAILLALAVAAGAFLPGLDQAIGRVLRRVGRNRQHPDDDAPVANDGNLTTNEDAATTGTLSATDIDSGTLTYAVVTQPAHGTVAIAEDGMSLTYAPQGTYCNVSANGDPRRAGGQPGPEAGDRQDLHGWPGLRAGLSDRLADGTQRAAGGAAAVGGRRSGADRCGDVNLPTLSPQRRI